MIPRSRRTVLLTFTTFGQGTLVASRRVTADELDALRAENDQLRAAVVAATDAARRSEAETGRLRGTIAEMQVQLARARQDQERFQRLLSGWQGTLDRYDTWKRRIASRWLRLRSRGHR